MELKLTDLNKDCLTEIFKHLVTEDKYRMQSVCKLFQTISNDALGITSRQPIFEKISNEIRQLQLEANKKKQQLFRTAVHMTIDKHLSDRWNRDQMVKIIERFNAMYSEIEQSVDPEYVLKDVTNIRFNVVYLHEGKCKTSDPFKTKGCSCPISSFCLEFDYPAQGHIGKFASSYSCFRRKQWDGYFRKTLVKYFGRDRLVHGGFSVCHLLEHIVFRVMQAEIAYRKIHHDDLFAIVNDYKFNPDSTESESDSEIESIEDEPEDDDPNDQDPGFDTPGAEPTPEVINQAIVQYIFDNPGQFQGQFEIIR